MEINNTTATTTSTSSETPTNPDSVLGKDDFLKLLLAELQYQDPTEPTDTEKILEQTSQLATLESQQSTNELMKELTDSFKVNQNFEAVNVIGKIAKMPNELDVKGGENTNIDIFFEDYASYGTIEISDKNGNVVDTMKFEDENIAGMHTFSWDAKNSRGESVEDGTYSVNVKYTSFSGKEYETTYGMNKVSSVKFEEDKAYLKIGDKYVDFDSVKEFYDNGKNL
jgi:flagellar basal-body rod modification protein FlgD